ncbi:hypothetical protein B0H16DRAFT_1690605 [Mycena metata]|uniref:Uncharacterized protein n=1 Tax=Mycena metata TaxID=1033252 RepID=A0AAD7IZR6_9AGAR|nr:hypothetical protein B0H16DRAFT_1690605 [Mycena metata]
MRMGGTFAQALQLAALIQIQIQSSESTLCVKDPTAESRQVGKAARTLVTIPACALAENRGQAVSRGHGAAPAGVVVRRWMEMGAWGGIYGNEDEGDGERRAGQEGGEEGVTIVRMERRREDAVGREHNIRVGGRRGQTGMKTAETWTAAAIPGRRRQFRVRRGMSGGRQGRVLDFVVADVVRVEVLRGGDERIESDKGSGDGGLERGGPGKAGVGGRVCYGAGWRRGREGLEKQKKGKNESVDGREEEDEFRPMVMTMLTFYVTLLLRPPPLPPPASAPAPAASACKPLFDVMTIFSQHQCHLRVHRRPLQARPAGSCLEAECRPAEAQAALAAQFANCDPRAYPHSWSAFPSRGVLGCFSSSESQLLFVFALGAPILRLRVRTCASN